VWCVPHVHQVDVQALAAQVEAKKKAKEQEKAEEQ
jgi:hypothetical protein